MVLQWLIASNFERLLKGVILITSILNTDRNGMEFTITVIIILNKIAYIVIGSPPPPETVSKLIKYFFTSK